MCWCYWRPPLLLPKMIVFFFCWLNGFLVLPTWGRSSAFVVGENWVAVGNWLKPLCLVPSTKCQVPSWFEGGFLVLLTRGSRWELSGGWELTDATVPLCTWHCYLPLCARHYATVLHCYLPPSTRQATTIQPNAGYKPPSIHTQEENRWEILADHSNVNSLTCLVFFFPL